MDDCSVISDLLVDYANRNLTREENSRVILHLSGCKNCLDELKEIIELRDMLKSQLRELPEDIRDAAFMKVRQDEHKLEDILESNSPFMAFDILSYALKPVKETLEAVTHLI